MRIDPTTAKAVAGGIGMFVGVAAVAATAVTVDYRRFDKRLVATPLAGIPVLAATFALAGRPLPAALATATLALPAGFLAGLIGAAIVNGALD